MCCVCVQYCWWVSSRFLGLSPPLSLAGPPFPWTAKNVPLFSLSRRKFILSLGERGSSRGIVAAVQGHGPPKMRVSVGVMLCDFLFGSGCWAPCCSFFCLAFCVRFCLCFLFFSGFFWFLATTGEGRGRGLRQRTGSSLLGRERLMTADGGGFWRAFRFFMKAILSFFDCWTIFCCFLFFFSFLF